MDEFLFNAEHPLLAPANDDVIAPFLSPDDFVRLLGAEVDPCAS